MSIFTSRGEGALISSSYIHSGGYSTSESGGGGGGLVVGHGRGNRGSEASPFAMWGVVLLTVSTPGILVRDSGGGEERAILRCALKPFKPWHGLSGLHL